MLRGFQGFQETLLARFGQCLKASDRNTLIEQSRTSCGLSLSEATAVATQFYL